ncbi:MAG: lysoplasmalogenase [Ferruginibacter sp.]
MRKQPAGYFLLIFITLSILAALCVPGLLFSIVKSLLMPALLLQLFFTGGQTGKKLITAALIFSWGGDILLLFDDKNPLFFILGLVCFLITHVLYIIYFFVLIKSSQPSLLKTKPLLPVLVAGYGIGLLFFLWPYLGEMKLPVLVYAVVICTMLMGSLHVFYKVKKPACILFICGALLFALSDSMLAVNKFYQPFSGAGTLIMLTYCAAQLLIVSGYQKNRAQ